MKTFGLFVWEIFKIVIISLAIIIPIRYFLVQPFFVKGASMEPNFEDNQYLLIDEISYRFREPQRGEVVVFKYPLKPSEFYIKRIIALPGESVQIKDSKISVYNKEHPDGFSLDESSYLGTIPMSDEPKITLKENEFFVLGDNRQASYDSRRWGPLPREDLIGRVWIRVWPLAQAQAIGAPAY
ncbi:MAG: signal peptidase I [Candidatus Portnoybacteria bacterium]|nr:signal peptidase I [Candidatus Portnoybacteria bacterium]